MLISGWPSERSAHARADPVGRSRRPTGESWPNEAAGPKFSLLLVGARVACCVKPSQRCHLPNRLSPKIAT